MEVVFMQAHASVRKATSAV